jgi:CRISPR-associated endoribonuclease Cas6
MTQHLYSTVLKLSPTSSGRVPTTQGRQVQGAFLNLIRTIDPDLSTALHVKDQRRPYTISPMRGVQQPHNGHFKIEAGRTLSLRCTLLTDQLFTTFTQYLLNPPHGRLPILQLGKLTLAITEMLTTAGSDAWAGYTSLNDLLNRWQQPTKAACKISLEFGSGVVFSPSGNKDDRGKFMEFFPSPEMFFGSVEARWRRLTGLSSPTSNKALRDYARETIVVSAFDMKTVLSHYWGHPQIGGLGRITYELRDTHNREMVSFLNLLADFAFYSGVGAKTAMGMGQVRRIEG